MRYVLFDKNTQEFIDLDNELSLEELCDKAKNFGELVYSEKEAINVLEENGLAVFYVNQNY